MNRKSLAIGSLLYGVGVVMACSGKVIDVSDGGPIGGDGGGGTSDAPLSPDCPASVPAAGSACAKKGVECEYGSDVDLACETLTRCDASGWTVTPPRAFTCPTPAPGPSCPGTYAAVPQGATCTTAASCAYPQGTCTCSVYCGSPYPVARMCDAGTPMTWHCGAAEQGCPAIRPHLGTACSQDQQFCQYGDCTAPAVRCEGGLWHAAQTACPVSTKRYKQGIHYLTDDERNAVADETLRTRLATYAYTVGDPKPRLGFIIEDDPASPAVLDGKDRVDLYGYQSMTVATLQVQSEQIAELRRELADVRLELKSARSVNACAPPATRLGE